jgi:hypothetical protein
MNGFAANSVTAAAVRGVKAMIMLQNGSYFAALLYDELC